MRYPPAILDEIRARLPVSRIVQRRVKLRRAGREYMGLSPFKEERTPSFSVNDQKGFYHCFASGEHGDIFTFVMKTEGLSFPETVERLASEAGVTLPKIEVEAGPQAEHETRVRECLEAACLYFQSALMSQEGSEARPYLERRGITARELAEFRIGYAPASRSALKTHLAGKGFTADEMQDAGLLIHGDDIPVSYDRFRSRVIFPISDGKKRVIAFGGRVLSKDQQPKYLNSPETMLFHKGRTLFNIGAAREHARQSKAVVVAEGYMDVIALFRAGIEHAVAPLGTALSEDQLRLLWAMAPMPTLCFDGDEAGKKAAFRSVDEALPHIEPGRSLQFVFLPEGQDPDDLFQKSGPKALLDCLNAPSPLFDVLWMREEARHPLSTPEQRAAFEDRLTGLAGSIGHKTLRFQYLSAIRERLRKSGRTGRHKPAAPPSDWRSRSNLGPGFGKPKRGDRFPAPAKEAHSATGTLAKSAAVRSEAEVGASREALLIKILLAHPWLIDEHDEEIAAVTLKNEDCKSIRDELLAVHQAELPLDSANLMYHLTERGCGPRLDRVNCLITHQSDGEFLADDAKDRVLAGWRHILSLHNRGGTLEKALREAEEDYLRDQNSENFARLCAIRQQLEFAIS